jgi:DNA-binding NarL/FixJ family response regulator
VDVALLDYDLGSSDGLGFIQRARQQGFEAPILMVTAGLNMAQARQVLNAGVAGIFVKDQSISSLISVVQLVARGERVIDPRYYEAMLSQPPATVNLPFTQREQDILNAIVEGLSNKEIGACFGMSETAVKSTVQRLFYKTGTRSRTQLLRFALERP